MIIKYTLYLFIDLNMINVIEGSMNCLSECLPYWPPNKHRHLLMMK